MPNCWALRIRRSAAPCTSSCPGLRKEPPRRVVVPNVMAAVTPGATESTSPRTGVAGRQVLRESTTRPGSASAHRLRAFCGSAGGGLATSRPGAMRPVRKAYQRRERSTLGSRGARPCSEGAATMRRASDGSSTLEIAKESPGVVIARQSRQRSQERASETRPTSVLRRSVAVIAGSTVPAVMARSLAYGRYTWGNGSSMVRRVPGVPSGARYTLQVRSWGTSRIG